MKQYGHRKVFVILGSVVGVISGLIVAAVMLAVCAGDQSTPTALGERLQNGPLSDNSTGIKLPPPKSIQDLVNRADAIVIGTVGGPIGEGENQPYSPELAKRDIPQPRSFPFIDYEILIDEVLLDDGLIESTPVLRVAARPDTGFNLYGTMRVPSVGGRYLFTLRANSDKRAYGVVYPWSLISVDGATVALLDRERSAPNFTDKIEVPDFVEAVKAAVLNWRKTDWPNGPLNFVTSE